MLIEETEFSHLLERHVEQRLGAQRRLDYDIKNWTEWQL